MTGDAGHPLQHRGPLRPARAQDGRRPLGGRGGGVSPFDAATMPTFQRTTAAASGRPRSGVDMPRGRR